MNALTIQQSLLQSGINRLDAEVLLAHALNVDRSYLYSHPEKTMDTDTFFALCQRRLQGEPIAYLIGKKEFWESSFLVNKNVLIPRPETELLVEEILSRYPVGEPLSVAELGTGSGAIALSLAKARANWKIVATDSQPEALKVAEQNQKNLNLSNVRFVQGDWCLPLSDETFDVIVSNPPYIAESDPNLQQGDLRFEPMTALVADDEGLADIQKIAEQARTYLKSSGILLFEHGCSQADAVKQCLCSLDYRNILCLKDLAGLSRVTIASSPK